MLILDSYSVAKLGEILNGYMAGEWWLANDPDYDPSMEMSKEILDLFCSGYKIVVPRGKKIISANTLETKLFLDFLLVISKDISFGFLKHQPNNPASVVEFNSSNVTN